MGTVVAQAYHPGNGATEDVSEGFSWPCLAFGVFWFVYKGMWVWALLSFVAACVSYGVSWFVFPFFANGLHARHLRRQGWLTEKEWKDRDVHNSAAGASVHATASSGSVADEIAKLVQLKERGALTQREFDELKAQLVHRL
jgi:hypothetical protein